MTTQFITLELPRPADPTLLIPMILQELNQRGMPLRWAITELISPGRIRVEAVVTVRDSL